MSIINPADTALLFHGNCDGRCATVGLEATSLSALRAGLGPGRSRRGVTESTASSRTRPRRSPQRAPSIDSAARRAPTRRQPPHGWESVLHRMAPAAADRPQAEHQVSILTVDGDSNSRRPAPAACGRSTNASSWPKERRRLLEGKLSCSGWETEDEVQLEHL